MKALLFIMLLCVACESESIAVCSRACGGQMLRYSNVYGCECVRPNADAGQ
jgi:hypothetical protein